MPMKSVASKSLICLALVALLGALAPMPSAAPSARSVNSGQDVLDQKRIHQEYNEGNFESVLATLQGFMSRNQTYSLDDSIFIAKHLAVVYSANPETREKGKYFMHRLLALVPSAKLIDMYVSDEIDRIFDKVREEFLARQKSFGVDSSQISAPGKPAPSPRIGQDEPQSRMASTRGSAAQPAREPARNSKPWLFAAGGAALVAVGVTSYFIFGDSQKQTEKIHEIP